MSVNVILEVRAKPENIDELRSVFEAEVKVIGNQDDPLNLILFETWETRAQYETYLAWRSETGALDALGALLIKAPSIRFFDALNN